MDSQPHPKRCFDSIYCILLVSMTKRKWQLWWWHVVIPCIIILSRGILGLEIWSFPARSCWSTGWNFDILKTVVYKPEVPDIFCEHWWIIMMTVGTRPKKNRPHPKHKKIYASHFEACSKLWCHRSYWTSVKCRHELGKTEGDGDGQSVSFPLMPEKVCN